MADVKLRKLVSTTFKLNGFSIRSDAINYLVTQLLPIPEQNHDEWLEKIVEHVQKHLQTNTVVEKSHTELAVKECINSGLDETETVFNVISAFDVPRFVYDEERRKFTKVELAKSLTNKTAPQLFDLPVAKAHLYKDRYTLLLQRTRRHKLFTPNIVGADKDACGQRFTLKPVDYLLSSSGHVKDAIVLGMLTQLREGRYSLEDPTGVVELDLSEARFHTGLHTENCFVLAEGWYEDKVFHVTGVGFPPPEPAQASRAYFGNTNTFGGPSKTSLKLSAKLAKHEQDQEDAMIVFLADVWLDSVKVMNKLKQLFAGYAECPPVAFILMGPFMSSQKGARTAYELQIQLRALADLILSFPALAAESEWVFIPGPGDPSAPAVLPRPSLPAIIATDLLTRLPHARLATNPCRLQYCTQELVVLRADLLSKLSRNALHFPEEGSLPDHLAKTLVSQAHLAPLPLVVCPVYWSHDPALQLYPLPDVIVVADQASSFTTQYMDCTVMNPGSFPRSDFCFKVYLPATREVEDSQLPSD